MSSQQSFRTPRFVALFVLSLVSFAASAAAQSHGSDAAPVELTAEQDRRRALDLLGIESLRRGVNARDPEAPNAANWLANVPAIRRTLLGQQIVRELPTAARQRIGPLQSRDSDSSVKIRG